MKDKIGVIIANHQVVIEAILQDEILIDKVEKLAIICLDCLKEGHKVLFCGNGGSAADAQHIAAELSGRFYKDREPLFAEALHVNSSYLTAVANDYGFEYIYSRLVRAKARKGDLLIGLSTSGSSQNIVNAFVQAKKQGVITIAMTGESGGQLAELSSLLINIPSNDTPRIQEAHILVGHILCELIESRLFT